MYEQIRIAQEKLKELRNICEHKNTFEGLYEYRPGATFPSIICSDCGTVIKSLYTFNERDSSAEQKSN